MTSDVRKAVLRSVRLDDDVWAAVKGMECSLNQYLREAFDLGEVLIAENGDSVEGAKSATASLAPSTLGKVAEIPGIQVGAADLPKNAMCRHCGARFAGSKYATICAGCSQNGHRGLPADCAVCGEGTGI